MRPLLLLLCACQAEYAVTVSFVDPATRAQAASVQLAVISSCTLQTLGGTPNGPERVVEFDIDALGPALGQVPPGAYGLYARVVDAGCNVIAAGCQPIEVEARGDASLAVQVANLRLSLCSAEQTCWLDVCDDADAGADASPDGVSAFDAGAFDALTSDAPIADTNRPDVVADAGGDLANSRSDYGVTQGHLGWFYGYWDEGEDLDGVYDPDADFRPFTYEVGGGIWRDSEWSTVVGEPTFSYAYIAESLQHPAVVNGRKVLIRRWVSSISGPARVFVAEFRGYPGGDGTTLRILVDGLEVDVLTQDGTSSTSLTADVDIELSAGTRIDFLHDSNESEAEDTTTLVVGLASRD